MPGNRDFLIGTAFAAASGCRLLDDPVCIELYGEAVLLTHGDTLCTHDASYQAFRGRVRDSAWQRAFLDKPVGERRRIAAGLRAASRRQGRLKPEAVLDVHDRAVIDTLSAYRASVLIHGHTHRQGVHALKVDGRRARRLALGDWSASGSVLECAAGKWRFRTLPREDPDSCPRRPAQPRHAPRPT
jgi:UDP-2,3-diacylglucosamine hydrolase